MSTITSLLTLCLLITPFQGIAQDDEVDLGHGGVHSERALRKALGDYLTRVTLDPHPQFRVELLPQFSSQSSEEFDFEQPATVHEGLIANVLLEFVSKDPAMDVNVRRFVEVYFRKRGYSRSGVGSPKISVNVAIAKPSLWRDIFGQSMATLAIALMLLGILFLIRPRGARRMVIVPGTDLPASVVHQSKPLALVRNVDVTPLHDLRQQQNPIDPRSGTWHWNSLAEMNPRDLQQVLMGLPFEQVLLVLQRLPRPIRKRVVASLNLHPAIRQKIQASAK